MTESPPSPITVDAPLIAAFDAHVLLDARLSWKAKGLAAILLSTGTWAGNEDITTEDLIALGTDGRDAILAGLRELEEVGYLTRIRRTGEGGRIYWRRVMRARPGHPKPVVASSLDTESSEDGKSVDGKPVHGEQWSQNGASLDTESSEEADYAMNGFSGDGADPATSGETSRTMNGFSGYGAGPDLTRTHARTDQDIYNSSSNVSVEEEEEYTDRSSSLEDLSSSTPQSDRARDQRAGSLDSVSSEKPDPALAKLCYNILTGCGVRVAAEHLYPRYPFEKIRAEAVRYMGEYTTAYARERNAGVLVHRIKVATYVELTETERMSSHYRQWRTEDECQADQAALMERSYEVPAPPTSAAPIYPDLGLPSAVWRQIQNELAIEQGGSFDRWVHDTWLDAYDEGKNLFTVALPDAFRYDWIVDRLSKQIKRKLTVITGQPADAKFIVKPRPLSDAQVIH